MRIVVFADVCGPVGEEAVVLVVVVQLAVAAAVEAAAVAPAAAKAAVVAVVAAPSVVGACTAQHATSRCDTSCGHSPGGSCAAPAAHSPADTNTPSCRTRWRGPAATWHRPEVRLAKPHKLTAKESNCQACQRLCHHRKQDPAKAVERAAPLLLP
jgi:hypothetical protein